MRTSLEQQPLRRQARRILPVAAAVALATGLQDAGAQGVLQPRAAQPSTGFETRAPVPSVVRKPRPLFTIGNVPAYVWSPVPAPYSGSAYDTLYGQPMRSGDTILTGNALGPPE